MNRKQQLNELVSSYAHLRELLAPAMDALAEKEEEIRVLCRDVGESSSKFNGVRAVFSESSQETLVSGLSYRDTVKHLIENNATFRARFARHFVTEKKSAKSASIRVK